MLDDILFQAPAFEAVSREDNRCDQCEVVMINGVRCHETGCPSAWRDETRECSHCGCDFRPESRAQYICSDHCVEGDFDEPEDIDE